jgi:hypothetical protein
VISLDFLIYIVTWTMKVEDIDIRTMDLKRGKTVVWSSGYQVQNTSRGSIIQFEDCYVRQIASSGSRKQELCFLYILIYLTKVRDRLLHCTQSWTCTPSSKGDVQRWGIRVL